MDVFLLCAGFGTRLKPLTDNIPKCLAPIKDVPLLAIWLNNLSKLSFVSRVFINTHYLADQVSDFLRSNTFNIDIELVVEDSILGTAGSIRSELARSTADEFLIIHGDNFSLQDFEGMYTSFSDLAAHRILTGLALGFKSEDYDNCGFYSYDNKSRKILSFIEKPGYKVKGLANGAVFMITRQLLVASLESSKSIDFCKDCLPSIVDHLCIFEATSVHVDIGLRSSLNSVQKYRDLFDEIILDKKWRQAYLERLSYNALEDQ